MNITSTRPRLSVTKGQLLIPILFVRNLVVLPGQPPPAGESGLKAALWLCKTDSQERPRIARQIAPGPLDSLSQRHSAHRACGPIIIFAHTAVRSEISGAA